MSKYFHLQISYYENLKGTTDLAFEIFGGILTYLFPMHAFSTSWKHPAFGINRLKYLEPLLISKLFIFGLLMLKISREENVKLTESCKTFARLTRHFLGKSLFFHLVPLLIYVAFSRNIFSAQHFLQLLRISSGEWMWDSNMLIL